MSQQQPPTGGPEEPRQWEQRFDTNTGLPLAAPTPATPAPPAPPTPAGADQTQFLDYQPSALPTDPAAPTTPALHDSPWAGNAPSAPAAPPPGPPGWNQPPGTFPPGGTDALGRTVHPNGYVARPSRGKLVGLVSLVLVLVGAVAAGTFLFLTRDDQEAPVAGGTTQSTTGPSEASSSATEATPSPSPTSPTAPSTSPTPSATPSITAPVVPSFTDTPTPDDPQPTLKTYGAQVDMSQFAGDWDFKWGDVELDAVGVSAANHPSCKALEVDGNLTSMGCRFAGETVQKNVQDKVQLTTVILEFGTAKQATAASKKVKDSSLNLTGRVQKDFVQGMWKVNTQKNLLVFTAATSSKKIDERLLNRYVGYRNADTTGALGFM